MTLLEHLGRACRTAAWRVGLVRDRSRRAAAEVERLIDGRGRALAEEAGIPGLAVVVRFAEGRTVRRAFGSAGASGAMRTDTVFPVLSISKAVTAFCTMTFVEKGDFALDEPVGRKLRSWRLPEERRGGEDADGITLRRVLSHGAGFDEVQYGRTAPRRPAWAKDYLAQCDADGRVLRVAVAPGTEFRYSGGGFALAQLMIEDATGTPFSEVARERVFRPLGMESSDYELLPALATRLVTGHLKPSVPVSPTVSPAVAAAGLFTTAEDLATFWGALAPGARGEPAGRGVLSPASCREMLSIQTPHPNGDGWGLGFRLKQEGSEVRYQHAGRDAGCFVMGQGLLRRRAVCTVFANADWGGECVTAVARELRHPLRLLPL